MQKTKQSIIKCAKSTYLGGIVDEQDLAALALQERLSVHHDLVDEVGHVALLLKDDAGQIQQHLRQQQLSAFNCSTPTSANKRHFLLSDK